MNAPTDWLITTAGQGAAGLLVWSWQATVLLLCVWAGLKICRAKASALRHQIWLFGLIAVAALPLFAKLAQRFPALQPSGATLRYAPVMSYVIEAPRVVIEAEPLAPAQALPAARPAIPTAKTSIVRPLLFTVWLIGALVMTARLLMSCIRLRRIRGGAPPVRPSDLDFTEDEALMTGKISLRLSSDIRSPLLTGVFRPAILLPADIVAWTTAAERAAIIQHELAHVARRDPLVNLFQTTLQVIFFFHPLVRYACRQMSLEREMACDDRVVASGVAAEIYAAGILKAAERNVITVATPSGAHQLALFSARQILERRLEMILNTNRARMIAHQWRHLVLPIAMIAVAGFLLIPRYSAKNMASDSPAKDSLNPAKGSPVKATYSAQEQELIDMIQQAAEAIPQQWHYRYQRAGLPDGRLTLDDFRVYDRQRESPLIIILPRPPQIPIGVAPGYSVSKVEVGAFDVSVNDDSAVIDFIGTLHLSVPGQDKETLVTDPYRVNLVKVNDQWQADRQNMPRGVSPMFWPPRPPAPPFETQGAHFEGFKHIGAMTLHNFGDAQFLVQSSLPFEGPQSVEMKLSEKELEYCRCKAWELQNAVVKLGELELRAEKGSRTLGSHVDAVHLKDRFEFRWGEQIYYGSGDITAGYHLQNKRLGLGSSPETRLYRTSDRTGEAITLQQLAQELKDQSLRKN